MDREERSSRRRSDNEPSEFEERVVQINRVSKVENYSKSIEIKRQQLASLEASVDIASQLFQNARAEYVEVLLAQRDLMEARMVLIETKKEQLSAIVNTYQALGGGDLYPWPEKGPHLH